MSVLDLITRAAGFDALAASQVRSTESLPAADVCGVEGCANWGTHTVSVPCLVDGGAGELAVPICDDHEIEALA